MPQPRLLRLAMEEIEHDGLPTCIETQYPRNVAGYERLGFQGMAEAAFPRLDRLRNWGMLRPARAEVAG